MASSGLIHAAAATIAARAAWARRHVGLALADRDDRQHALEILGVAGRAGGFVIPEDQLFELARTLATHILVKRHEVAPLKGIG
jgi:hypothetical protein